MHNKLDEVIAFLFAAWLFSWIGTFFWTPAYFIFAAISLALIGLGVYLRLRSK